MLGGRSRKDASWYRSLRKPAWSVCALASSSLSSMPLLLPSQSVPLLLIRCLCCFCSCLLYFISGRPFSLILPGTPVPLASSSLSVLLLCLPGQSVPLLLLRCLVCFYSCLVVSCLSVEEGDQGGAFLLLGTCMYDWRDRPHMTPNSCLVTPQGPLPCVVADIPLCVCMLALL